MSSYLTVSPEDIKQLSDTEFRELVARLCQAEVTSSGYDTSAVTFGGDQRATDGGIDVRISLKLSDTIRGYVPAPHTGIQVKAEIFGPSDITLEMKPGGNLRPSILELIDRKGAYIIASSKSSVSDSALKLRRQAMRACVADTDPNSNLEVDFYDCQRIASWVEKFPSLIAWLRHLSGRRSHGWRGYGAWAHKEVDVKAEYLLDEATKIFAPSSDEPLIAEEAIRSLRQDLAIPGTCVRLTGLSGVGKTRLAQSLFDERIGSDVPALDQHQALYADSGDSPEPLPIHLAEELLQTKSNIVFIIDNCSSEQHNRLAEKISTSRHMSLLTIEYDIREDFPEQTKCYRLEPSSDALIKKMLLARYPNISGPDADTISDFSGGNSRIAIALAETAEVTGQLSKLKDDALFQRLFRQKNADSDELQQAAQICSLLYSFQGELLSGGDAELPVLASLLGMEQSRLLLHVAELQRRGLVQQRGPWRACLPHALANRLAERALSSYPIDFLQTKLVKDASERIAKSFSRRLGYLSGSGPAEKIVKDWLKPEGMLGNITLLNDLGLQMFCNVAPVDVAGALSAIRRALPTAQFKSNVRRMSSLIRVVRGAAYEPSLFLPSIETLLDFAAADPSHAHRDINGTLEALFYIHYSGTQASPEARAGFIRDALASDSPDRQKAGLSALSASLKVMNFHHTYNFEFGPLPRSYGWHPANTDDVKKWFTTYLRIAADFGVQKCALGKKIRSIVGRKLSGLWWRTPLTDTLEEIAVLFSKVDGWPDGWQGVKQALRYAPKEETKNNAVKRLNLLKDRLAPANLVAEVQALVLSEGHAVDDLMLMDDGDTDSYAARHNKLEQKIRELGNRVGRDKNALSSLSEDLVRRHDKSSWSFGRGVGEATDDPIFTLKDLKRALAGTPENQRSLQFVAAFIYGAQEKHLTELSNYMDECILDDVWAEHFPRLQAAIPLDELAAERLIKCAQIGRAPSFEFDALAGGMVTETLNADQVSRIILAVAAMTDGPRWAASILTMVFHLAGNKSEEYLVAMRATGRKFLLTIDWASIDEDPYRLAEIAKHSFVGEGSGNDAASLSLRMQSQLDGYRFYKIRDVLTALFHAAAGPILDAIFVPDEDGGYRTAGAVLSASDWIDVAPINAAPPDEVVEWCMVQPESRLSFIAHHCSLFNRRDDDEDNGWSDLALALMDNSGDRNATVDVFKEHLHPRSWSGSLAKILRSRIELLDALLVRYPDVSKDKIAEIREELEGYASWSQADEERRMRSINETFE